MLGGSGGGAQAGQEMENGAGSSEGVKDGNKRKVCFFWALLSFVFGCFVEIRKGP